MKGHVHAIADLQVAVPTHLRDDLGVPPVIAEHERLITERFCQSHRSGETGVAKMHVLRPHPQGNARTDGRGWDDRLSERDIELRRPKAIAPLAADVTSDDVHRRRPE